MASKFSSETLKEWFRFSGLPNQFYPNHIKELPYSESFKTKVKSTYCPTISESKERFYLFYPSTCSSITTTYDRLGGVGYMCSRYIFDKGCCAYFNYSDLVSILLNKDPSEDIVARLNAKVVFVDCIFGLGINEEEQVAVVSYLYKRFMAGKKTVLCFLEPIRSRVDSVINPLFKDSITLSEL